MKLPLAGKYDPRPPYSPIFSLQSFFLGWNYRLMKFRIGVKNLLDFKPFEGVPFLIARAEDPFDKQVKFDNTGNPIPTPDNPYGLTFDTSYIYAPLLGRQLVIELNWQIE